MRVDEATVYYLRFSLCFFIEHFLSRGCCFAFPCSQTTKQEIDFTLGAAAQRCLHHAPEHSDSSQTVNFAFKISESFHVFLLQRLGGRH